MSAIVSALRSSSLKDSPPLVVDAKYINYINSIKSSSALAIPFEESIARLDNNSNFAISHLDANIRLPRGYDNKQDEFSIPTFSLITSSSSLASEASINFNTSLSFIIPKYDDDIENLLLPPVEQNERYRFNYTISLTSPINYVSTGAESANKSSNIP